MKARKKGKTRKNGGFEMNYKKDPRRKQKRRKRKTE
jgi:hypothetical protein